MTRCDWSAVCVCDSFAFCVSAALGTPSAELWLLARPPMGDAHYSLPSPRCCSSGRRSPARRVFQHCYLFLQSTLVARAKLARNPWARRLYIKLLFYLGRDPTCVAVANTTSLFFGTVQQTYQLGYFQTAPLYDPGSHTHPHSIGERPWPLFLLASLPRPAPFASE